MVIEPNPYPMLLNPVFKDNLWGGERLIHEYNKNTGLRPVAESWELSCHPDGPCTVQSGGHTGKTLAELLDAHPRWISPGASGARDFPILIKFIDAKQDLSLQVHPGDAYAREHENDSGKNEAWYVLDCEPGATLILGMKKSLPAGGAASLIKSGKILEYANIVPVKPGDCYCVPAGLLHAIGGGVLIAEVQQSSNVTYRVYDYGRVGADGKPRLLHIEQAAEVVDGALQAYNRTSRAPASQCGEHRVEELVDWSYFKMKLLDIDGDAPLDCGAATFHALLVIDGGVAVIYGEDAAEAGGVAATSGEVAAEAGGIAQSIRADKGSCVFVPAGTGRYILRGRGRILLTTI